MYCKLKWLSNQSW